MAKAEITWKRINAEGIKIEVYAQHVGDRWIFHKRLKRFDRWEDYPEPELEDWLELLDSIKRRVNRMLQKPEEPNRIRKAIRERFPNADLAELEKD